jgi:dCMP deaminase
MRPTREETLLQVAGLFAQRSTCSRLSVGAVIARDGRILTTGYNGSPAGMAHCEHEKDEPCAAAVHAEMNAIAFAAREGVATNGAEMFLTHAPCLNCAKLIINAGIVMVYYRSSFRDMNGVHLLKEANVGVFWHG